MELPLTMNELAKAIQLAVTRLQPWSIALAAVGLVLAWHQLRTNRRVNEATLLVLMVESLQTARQAAKDAATDKLFALILSLKVDIECELGSQQFQKEAGIYLQAALDLSRSKGTDLDPLCDAAGKAIAYLRSSQSLHPPLKGSIDALQRKLDELQNGPPVSDRTSHIRILEQVVQMGIKLNGLSFRDSCLDGARLSRGSFVRTNLWRASFIGSDLSRSDLRRANPQRARFQAADLAGADLSGCQFQDANLWHAKLTGAKLEGTNLCQAKLGQCNLSNTDLRGAIGLTEGQLAEAYGSNVKLPNGIDVALAPPPDDWERSHQHFRDEFAKTKGS